MSRVKLSLSRDAFDESPMDVSAGHASSMYLRRFASAFGAGSVAITSKPRARNSAAQLAPMTPVPTMAIRRIGLSELMCPFLLYSEAGFSERSCPTSGGTCETKARRPETSTLSLSQRVQLLPNSVSLAYVKEETG